MDELAPIGQIAVFLNFDEPPRSIDLAGIGEKRKMALLKAFGSVRELRKADAKTICRRVPGIGEMLAAEIVSALNKKR